MSSTLTRTHAANANAAGRPSAAKLAVAGLTAVAAVGLGGGVAQASSATPHLITAPAQHQSLSSCLAVAKSINSVRHGDFRATVAAVRNIGGCGGTLADGICYASEQWWGGPARSLVSWVTNGQENRC